MRSRTSAVRRKSRRVARYRKLGRELNHVASASPEVAVKLLMRSFVYPQRRLASPEALRVLERAETLSVPFGGGDLLAYRWASRGAEGPTVALFHDYERESGYFASYVAPLLDKGCTVVALDAPASGRSPGRRLSLRDYINAVHRLSRITGLWHAAAGHGMGAAALVQAVAQMRSTKRPARLATLGMNADSKEIFAQRLTALGVSDEVSRRFWRKLESLRDVPLSNYDNVRAVARLGDVSGLVLHDADDARFPLADAEAISGAWPGARLERLEGFGHELSGTAILRRVIPFAGAKTALREMRAAA